MRSYYVISRMAKVKSVSSTSTTIQSPTSSDAIGRYGSPKSSGITMSKEFLLDTKATLATHCLQPLSSLYQLTGYTNTRFGVLSFFRVGDVLLLVLLSK